MPSKPRKRLARTQRPRSRVFGNPSGAGDAVDTPGNPNPKGKLLATDYPVPIDPLHPTFAFAALGWTDTPGSTLTSVGFLFTSSVPASAPSGAYLKIKAPSAISSYYDIYSDSGKGTSLSFDTLYNQFFLAPKSPTSTSLGGGSTAQNFPIYGEASTPSGSTTGSVTFQVSGLDVFNNPQQSTQASFDVYVTS